MSKFYCEYCGSTYPSIASMTAGTCSRHPDGPSKGRHRPYEGAESSQYACRYCGSKYPTIASLTAGLCSRHPDGTSKGRHSPSLRN